MKLKFEKTAGRLPKWDLPIGALVFFLLFAPPIVPEINTALIAAAIAGCALLVCYRKDILPELKKSGILLFAVAMTVFFVYLAGTTLVNFLVGERVQLMHYTTLWYRFFLIVPILLINYILESF